MSYSASFGLMLIRGMVGYIMFYHGSQKLFGWFDGNGMEGFIGMVGGLDLPGGVPPKIAAYTAAVSEFGGGILLMLGLLTRLAAIPVAVAMGVAAFKVHNKNFAVGAEPVGMEYALTLMVVAIGLIFTGPGKFALDNLFARKKPNAKPAEKKR